MELNHESEIRLESIANKVLIVDDEKSIRKTLASIFQDEGYQTLLAEDGLTALEMIKDSKPDLVLLDIWLPGMDGMEVLRKIKKFSPTLPVIMISGHATIATAVKATRLGAENFIEKPLDMHAVLELVKNCLADKSDEDVDSQDIPQSSSKISELIIGKTSSSIRNITPIVFENQPWKGEKIVQKTLCNSTLLYGQGLHSGQKSGLILEPLPENSGIHFMGVSESDAVPAHANFVESTGFATTIKLKGAQAGTIEHLMSALHAFRISNLLIKCNGEVPVLDGSAAEFCDLFDEIGVEEQAGDWFEIAIPETIQFGEGEEYIKIEPADNFTVEYQLRYPEPLGNQEYVFTLSSVDSYRLEISSARTFGFVKDIEALQKAGLAQGGRFDNFVLYGDEGAINTDLRYPNEAVRHKILDTIGDLYLLGRPLRGKVTACMTGHSDNIGLLKMVRDRMAG